MMNLKKNPKFKVGQIYRMAVAARSHMPIPYYVMIKEVGNDHIVTTVPGMHDLKISRDSNWDYQIPRMTYIGIDRDAETLLNTQFK